MPGWRRTRRRGAFFRFALTVDHRGMALEVRAPADAHDVLAALFGAPTLSRSGGRGW